MAYIAPKTLNFQPSPDDGATSYLVWIVVAGTQVDYTTIHYNVGMETSVDLAELVEGSLPDDDYEIHVAAKDDAGNISDIFQIPGTFFLDMIAPLPILSGTIN